MLVQKVPLVAVASLRKGMSRCLENSSSTTDMYNCLLVSFLPSDIYHLGVPEAVVVCLAVTAAVIFQRFVQSLLDS